MLTALLKAHELAYKRCDLIHRDVSFGNILILPLLQRVGNKYRVRWKGVLSDWELAKPSDPRLQESLSATASSPQMVGLWYHYYIPNEAH